MTAVSYGRHEVRDRLEAAVRSALAAPGRKRQPDGAPEPVLSRRELRKLEAALAAIEGGQTTTAALDAAGSAIARLAESADPQAGDVLLRHLDRLPQLRRVQAIRALGELKADAAFEPLLNLLAEHDEALSPAALAALGSIGDPRAASVLLTMAALAPEQHARALDAIATIGAPAIAALQGAFQPDAQRELKLAALEALGRIKDAKAGPLLSRFTGDPDADVRRQAVEALAQLETPAALRALAAALSDESEPVRSAAASGLSRMADKRLVPFLLRAVRDPSRDVRLLVVRALGLCGEDSAVEALRPLVTCGDGDLELEAAEAVARLGDHAAVPRLLEKLEFAARLNGDEPQALKMIDALRRLKDDRAVLPLIDLLGHRSERIRSRAAEALGQIGDRTAVGPIADLFDRERAPLVMASAARALGDLQDPAGLSALQAALQQADPVRIKAVIALGEIGGIEALEMAAGRLGDPSSQVRYQVVTVLGRSGKKEFTAQLAPLIDDPDEMVRRATLKALQELGDTRPEAEIRKSVGKHRRKRSPRGASRPAWSVHDLVPAHVLGLMSPKLAAIAVGTLVVTCLVAALVWWRPFSTAASSNLPRGRVHSLSFAGDGATLAAGRTFRLVEIWNAQIQSLQITPGAIEGDHVAFDASGSRLLSCDGARSALYDLQTGQTLAEESGIKALAVNLLSTRAATQSTDGRIIVWNLESGQIDARLQFDRPDTTAFAVDADGQRCAIGTMQGGVFVADVVEQAVVRELQVPDKRAVQSLAFDPAKTRLAIGTASGAILLADVEGDEPPEKFGAAGGGTASHLLFLDSTRLLAARGGAIEVFDLTTGKSDSIAIDLPTLDAVAVTRDGQQVAVGSVEESAILVFDLASQQQVAELDVK